jgi:hypothetical protein
MSRKATISTALAYESAHAFLFALLSSDLIGENSYGECIIVLYLVIEHLRSHIST